MTETTKVLLVDDHTVVREGIRTMLSAQPDIAVVGEAASGDEAIQKVSELQPHVVLMDIRLPGMSGTEATRQIKQTHPTVAVIMLTMYDSEMYVVESIRAGAAGYLTKDVSSELLCHAIRSTLQGGSMVRTGLLRSAIDSILRNHPGDAQKQPGSQVEQLTARELDVLKLLTRGYGNRQMCEELHLAEVTIKKYVQSIIQKLGASDRTHAAIQAVRLGLAE